MANNGQTNSSQFFITLSDLDDALRSVGVYTIFGNVIDGTDVVDSIAAVPVSDPQLGLPLTPVIIESITISTAAEPSPSAGE
jgi:cyclophilin family peptidyl-prolyl cis-trans isomerase